MSAFSPYRVGSLEWLQQTGGITESRRERWRLIGEIYLDAPPLIVNYARAVLWKWKKPAKRLILRVPHLPESSLVDEAVTICRHTMSTNFFNHSMRTWIFGSALATADDPEQRLDQNVLFFVAALFHDLGLAGSTYNRCFTLAGVSAVEALKCRDADNPDVWEAASAIGRHISPRLKRDEGLAFYLQRGSLLDLTGARVSRFSHGSVEAVYRDYPASRDANREGAARWRADAALAHHSRAQLLQTWGRFGVFLRFGALPLVNPGGVVVHAAAPASPAK